MRKILRRVAVLEKLIGGRPEQDEAIVERAVRKLSLKEMELLLLASAADREGRGLTEPERAAKQAYQLALRTECLAAGRRSTGGFSDTLVLDRIIREANLLQLSCEEMSLLYNGQAQQEGRPLNADEAAGFQIWENGWDRLSEMAGLSSNNVDQGNSSN
jgi:hypothetical protein